MCCSAGLPYARYCSPCCPIACRLRQYCKMAELLKLQLLVLAVLVLSDLQASHLGPEKTKDFVQRTNNLEALRTNLPQKGSAMVQYMSSGREKDLEHLRIGKADSSMNAGRHGETQTRIEITSSHRALLPSPAAAQGTPEYAIRTGCWGILGHSILHCTGTQYHQTKHSWPAGSYSTDLMVYLQDFSYVYIYIHTYI